MILKANASMASQALRALAVAYRPLDAVPDEPKPADIERELIFVGLQGMIDPARAGGAARSQAGPGCRFAHDYGHR